MALALSATPIRAATNDLTSAIQRGLFEEEANQNLGAAIQAYQAVASQFDKDRKLAATAIFRLGECYRKQGNTNEAAGQYERILREFSDQSTLVTLSRQNLATLGTAPAAAPVWSDAARQEQKRLLDEELKLVQKQLEIDRQKAQSGIIPSDAVLVTEREVLKLKRQVAAVGAGQPISVSATEMPAPSVSNENAEIRRIEALIKDSPDLINAPDASGKTLLQQAAASGKVAVVKLLLDSGAAVDGLQQPRFTALHYAAGNGHKAVVDLLLSRGAKPNAENGAGITPLHLATFKGYEGVVKALLAAGASINALTKSYSKGESGPDLQYNSINSDVTPLYLAVDGGYAGLVELLLAKGADINAGGETPLICAIRRNNLPLMRLLLAAHADPNTGRWSLPLFDAIRSSDAASLKLLLANGADPNTNALVSTSLNRRSYPQGTKITPLFYAVNLARPEAVTELLAAKADPNTLGPEGDPVLFEALIHPATLKALLEGGADPNRLDRQGVAALLRANGQNMEATALTEALLAHKADPNARMPDTGYTALHLAAQYGRKEVTEMLLKSGAAINAQENNGWTPLYVAVGWNQPEVARVLLANHADPNIKGKDGRTPLHVAVNDMRRELIEPLLANGADPNERDLSGGTPLDIAKNQTQVPRPGLPVAPSFRNSLITGAPMSQASQPQSIADLLRQHGASDNLPRLDRITFRRSATGYSNMLMTKGAKDWNQFSLLELLAVQYKILAQSPNEGGGPGYMPGTLFMDSRVPFPDLSRIHISRPAEDKKSWQDQVVDLSPALSSGDCTKDVRLGWGDVVEIPEADHTLNESWRGFSKTELANFKKCLTRQVEIVVKGQATQVTLAPKITIPEEPKAPQSPLPPGPDNFQARLQAMLPNTNPSIQANTPFWLKPVLLQSKLVLVSSDLSRVKVTRKDESTGEKREWVVDCSEASPAPDFWLENGDRIEVPEKTFSLGPQSGQGVAAASTGARPSSGAAMSISSESPISFSVPGHPSGAAPGDGRTPGMAPTPPRTLRVPPTPPTQAARPPVYLPPGQELPKPAAIDPATGLPIPQTKAKPAKLPLAEDPGENPKTYLDVGGVCYSPKPEDPKLLDSGYHKDRSAKTRQGECWEQRASSDLSGRACPGAWTGTDMIVFGGEGMGTSFADGARYCLAEDTWAMLPSEGAPSSRTGHAVVWAGKELIVWGGFGGLWGRNTNRNDGARYNPATDAWKPMTTKNAPEARFDFSAVWSGREFLVWGGYTDGHSRYQGCHADAHLNTGGRYSPSLDAWRSMSIKGAPSKRNAHTAVWSGSEMIIWGGANTSKVLGDGGRYNPSRDTWKPVSSEGAPNPRAGHVAVWTGKEMLVWGGSAREPQGEADYYVSGGRYDPATDTWKPMSAVGAPSGRVITCAVWTGKEMLVWGGVNDSQEGGRFVGTGGRYNPATDAWTEMTLTGAPGPRLTWGAWTGESLLTFGGYNGAHLNESWLYSPSRTLYPYTKK